MNFKVGPIDGVEICTKNKHTDERGWLVETFRHDEMDKKYFPVMSYISLTLPGIVRGPHEHIEQSDLFIFIGPGTFKMWLWDNRESSNTFCNKMVLLVGEDNQVSVLVPPGIVHAYKNITQEAALVYNFPNKLFMGEGKKHPVDEIRHEDDPNSAFQID